MLKTDNWEPLARTRYYSKGARIRTQATPGLYLECSCCRGRRQASTHPFSADMVLTDSRAVSSWSLNLCKDLQEMAIFRLPPFLTVTPGSLPGGPVSYGGYGGRPGAWPSSPSNYLIIAHVPLFKPFLKTATLVSIICSRTLPDAFPRSMGSLGNSNRLDWPCDLLLLLRCAQGDFCLPNNTPLVSMQLQGPFILKTSPHTFLNTKKHIYERLKPYIATIST